MLKKHFFLLLMLMLLNNFVKPWYTTIQKLRVSKQIKMCNGISQYYCFYCIFKKKMQNIIWFSYILYDMAKAYMQLVITDKKIYILC